MYTYIYIHILSQELGYSCPPPALISGVVRHAHKHQARLILVMPAWIHLL